jgi:predicted permease
VIGHFVADARHGVRVFLRQPLRTAVAVVTLSLAVGANTAIFSVLHAVMFRPFAFPAADRAVVVVERLRSGGGTSPTIPEVLDLRARSRTLEQVTFFDTRDFQVDGGAEPARVLGARVDARLLPLVGAQPVLGRLFADADSADASPRVLLLSDGFWRRQFGADPAVVGRTLAVNGAAHAIVGVLSQEFGPTFLMAEPPEIYVPYPMTPDYALRSGEFANVRRVMTIGRTAPDVSREAVSAELATIAAALATEHPALYADLGGAANFVIDVEPLRAAVGDGSRAPLLLLFGAVAVVLLIGCVNAAQFLLSHAIEREPEVALRGALGASRGRLIGQFLSETLVLTLTATIAGVLQAVWLVAALRALLPPMMMVGRIELDVAALAFAVVVAALITLLCGVAPSLRFSRVSLRGSLRLEPRGSLGHRRRARQVLVAAQVALSVVLLVQGVLLGRTLRTFARSQSGFSAGNVTAMRIRGMGGGPTLGLLYSQYLERIAGVPGVDVAAIAGSALPGRPGTSFTIVGASEDDASRSRQSTSYQIVSPEYFSTLQIPVREGRTFTPGDTADAAPVAIVNEEMARYFAGASPIGRQIRAGDGPRDSTMTIVGVVGNVRSMAQTEDHPQLFVSYLQQSEPNMFVLVRPRALPLSIDAVKRAIWSVEPRQAVFSIRALDDVLAQSIQGGRIVTMLVGSVALLALAMSLAGVFAVVSYLTSRRHKEVALRRAMGAQAGDILWLLSNQTFRWTLVGLVIGVGGAVLASRALGSVVAGLVPLDAATGLATASVYLVVAAAAMLIPAARAARVDPASALRSE